jgi:hypothetical protein
MPILRIHSVRPSRANVWWCVHAAVVVVLVSVNLSTATYNPAYHPQNPNWNPAQQQHPEQQQHYQTHVHWRDPARGGSIMVAPAPEEIVSQPQQPAREEIYQPPRIMLKHMSMALRVTSEWNRRLLNGVNHFKFWQRKQKLSGGEPAEERHSPINVHPSRPWHPPIPAASIDTHDYELTLFHAKAPRTASRDDKALVGVARWGPELLPYLEHIVDLLGISADGVEIALAMIYLDRACSVETQRSNGVPPCPFCLPRTVHRLSLASLLLATQAVNGISDEEMMSLYEKISSLGIPGNQLEQMVEWMRGALGDAGLSVTIPQMHEWGRHWESIFMPERYRSLHSQNK